MQGTYISPVGTVKKDVWPKDMFFDYK